MGAAMAGPSSVVTTISVGILGLYASLFVNNPKLQAIEAQARCGSAAVCPFGYVRNPDAEKTRCVGGICAHSTPTSVDTDTCCRPQVKAISITVLDSILFAWSGFLDVL